MKKILAILILACNIVAAQTFKPRFLPSTTTGTTAAYLVLDDTTTKKITVANFLENYINKYDSITYADLATAISGGALSENKNYFITDKNIFVKATSASSISESALLKATNADYNNVSTNFLGVWSGTTRITFTLLTGWYDDGEIVSDNTTGAEGEMLKIVDTNIDSETVLEVISSNGTAYSVGDTITGLTSGATGKILSIYTSPILSTIAINKLVAWNNIMYTNKTGSATIKHPKYDATNWTALATTDANYQVEYDPIIYNFTDDLITKREDKRGNVVIDRFGVSTVKFQWGRDATFGNNIFSFGYNGYNAIRAQNNMLIQNSGVYIGDSAVLSYSTINNRSTVIMIGSGDALSATVMRGNLTMFGGKARDAEVGNYGDLTVTGTGDNGGDTQYRQCKIILKNSSSVTDCIINGGYGNFSKSFSNETHQNQIAERGIGSTFDISDTINGATTNLSLDASRIYGVYKLVIEDSAATVSAITNMTTFPVRLEPTDSSALILVNSGTLVLKSGQNDTIPIGGGWIELETINTVLQEQNSSLSTGGGGGSSLTGATGDIISFSATDTQSNISAVSAGSYLRSNGTSTLPLWSTLKLPNSATANYIPYATSTNTWGESIDMRFDGTTFKLFNSFPSLHVRSNIASNGGVLVYQRGGENISSANQRYALNIAAYGNGGAFAAGNMCMIGFTHADATTTLYTPSTIIGSVFETGGEFGNSGFFVATRSVTTNTRPTERFRVANNGNVSIGTGAIGTALLHIAAGTATAGTAPLKTPEGTLLTTPESGAHEFANDKAYYTIPTGTARKEFTLNDAALTSTYLPMATTNGRLTNSIIKQDGSNNIITQDAIWGAGAGPSTGGIFGSSASGSSIFFNLLTSKDVVLSTDAGLFDGTGAELTLDTAAFHIYLPTGELRFGRVTQFSQPFDCKITGVGKTYYQHFGSVGDMFNDATLVSGTLAITITGLATTDRAFVQLTTPGGTLGTHYKAVCTANTLTITAVDTAGSTVTSDTSTLTYHIIRKSN